jgi:ADP-ribose pyrophosphatase
MNCVASSVRFEGRIVRVRVDDMQMEDGRIVRQEVVEHAQSVTVVPMLDRETVLLVRQYRHPTGETLLETLAGSVDPGESPEVAAQREMAEEIGRRAGRLIPVGSFYLAPGWATELMHAFVAFDLQEAQGEADEDERIELVPLPVQELWRRIRAGEIRDCKTLAAMSLAQPLLEEIERG